MEVLIAFILFAVFGVAHEVFWTALLESRNRRLKGRSSLWMFPIYGCILFIVMLVQWLYGVYPWWFRGLMYAALILCWEYISGWLIKRAVGMAPWDYEKETPDGVGSPKRFHLHGLVYLEYAPVWFVEGLIAEWFYLLLHGVL